jgi:thiol-disulfide isomerase/thioredoxin
MLRHLLALAATLLALAPLGQAAAPPPSGRDELLALDKRWTGRARQYLAAAEKEKSPEKLAELALRLLPFNDPKEVEAFFDLEKRYRGKDVGLFSLNFVIMRATQVANPDMPVARGRERALVVLRKHYLAHADLDYPLGYLRNGPLVFGGEELLKAAVEKSPHEHVRAAALFYWADLLKQKADLKTILEARAAEKAPASATERWYWEINRKTLARLKSFDEKVALEEAKRLAKRVRAEYPKTAPPFRIAEAGAPFMPKRIGKPKPPSPKVLAWLKRHGQKWDARAFELPTYAKRAEALLFEMTQLVVGQAAPSLEGRDADGKPFRLSDCKGKVIVLMFSANWCAPCKARYPSLRALQKKFKGRPLEVVTVMADGELKTVRAAIDRGDITWRAVWDGAAGPIASRWNVQGLPTLYVIDRRGVIRDRDAGEGELARLVGELLNEAR